MMAEPATPTLQKALRLLRKREYSAALTLLESFDTEGIADSQLAWHGILLTEALLFVGKSRHDLVDRALDILKTVSDSELLARAQYAKGCVLCAEGQIAQAGSFLRESLGHCLRANDRPAAARVLNRLAYVALRLGDIHCAVQHLESTLETYETVNRPMATTRAAHNLASVLYYAGELKESIGYYFRFPPPEQEPDEILNLNYFSMSSLPYALKGDLRAAHERLDKCKPYVGTYKRGQAIFLGNVGMVNVLDGKYTVAEKALKEGLELSLQIAPESSLDTTIKRLFGDLYVATEKYDLAEQYATEALAIAEKINERIEIAACWRIFAQAANHRGDAAKTQEWFQKAIDMFGLIGARYELAVTRYLAGVSGIYGEGERTALLYMARDYFEAEGVAPYLAKIDALIPEAAGASRFAKVPARVANGCPMIIAKSQIMKELLDLAEHVAPSEMTVFLTGETGTGKDLLAHYIHFCSGRKGEFVTVNAAAIPNPMIESELFGHTKGAFTSADRDRPGLLEQADNGTFYLNEIADATPELQAKLLEVLETREVRRLGANQSRKINFQLIAATNHDLKARMHDGHFRVDLYHRLNEIPLTLPPLSARTEDIPPLVAHFLKEAGYTEDGDGVDRLAGVLALQDYPGNVRELQARVKHLVAAGKDDIERMIALAKQSETECERLVRALETCDWNRREAARMLGTSESAIRRRIVKYDLTEPHSV